MSLEENKAIVKRNRADISKGNAEAVRELHSLDFIHHNKDGTRNFDDIFPRHLGDQITIVDMVAKGNRVVSWETWQSDERTASICIILRIHEGKIAETWNMSSIQGNFKSEG